MGERISAKGVTPLQARIIRTKFEDDWGVEPTRIFRSGQFVCADLESDSSLPKAPMGVFSSLLLKVEESAPST